MRGNLPIRVRDAGASAGYASAALAGCVVAGYLSASLATLANGTTMLPWLAGRALGLGAYAALVGLMVIGTWIRHPWRFRWPLLHPEVRLRTHAVLGAATVVLIAGHLVSLALDRYARVGWVGAFVPGMSSYRTVAVGLGVVAFELMVAVAATAVLAGRLGGGRWLPVHRAAGLAFVSAWFHGVLAGTDTPALRPVYMVTGLLVGGLLASSRLAGRRGLATDGVGRGRDLEEVHR